MKVLHVITGLGAGGAEHQLRLLVRHLPVECEVATLTNPGILAAAIRADGTRVVDLGMRHNRDLLVLPRLAALMRRGRYDVVHTHLYRACLYGRVAARMAGVPHVVATEHSLGDTLIEGRRSTPWVRRLYLATGWRTDATIAVSAAVAGRLAAWGVPAERIAMIPNGIQARQFRYDPGLRAACRARLGLGRRDLVVGAVARLEPAKRLDQLVRAMAGLDSVTLLVVGEGSQRAGLEELAGAAGVGPRVRFTGDTPDVLPALCAMDVLASPSPEETFGLAVLEALACGLPVVYASCPALEELPAAAAPAARKIPPGVPALRSALAAALASLPPDGTRLRPPPAVAQYDIAPLAARVADLYRRVLSADPAPAGAVPIEEP